MLRSVRCRGYATASKYSANAAVPSAAFAQSKNSGRCVIAVFGQ